MKLYLLSLCALTFFSTNVLSAFQICSPGKLIKLEIRENDKSLSYNLSYRGVELITASKLGLISTDANLSRGYLLNVENSTTDQSWKPLFGKTSLIVNHYNESIFHFKTESGILLKITFRVFDDGVAFRYELPEQKEANKVLITNDLTEFHFADDYISRGIDRNIESSEFAPKPLSKTQFSKLPLLVQTPSAWIAINEASVFDFSEAYLVNNEGKSTMSVDIGKSECNLPMKTPWRVIQLGATAGDLIASNILVNLNEPCKIEDPSWIKPGKSMWDWRNHGDTINGFVYGINEASYHRLIDFASANAVRYVLFDADWYSENGPQFPRKDLDMPEIIRYANKKKVDILLYLDRHRIGNQNKWSLEEVLKIYQQWGAKGIKYGFLGSEMSDRKAFVDTTRSITRLCAKYHMLVTFHDNPVHPGGEERTWPNLMAKEYCHGQQDSRRSFGPYKAVTVPFINGLSGPLDMTNGYYDLNGLKYRTKVDKKGLNSTVVGENARCFINYTPLLVLPDNGDEYNKKSDLFDFIRQMPDTWDEIRLLSGSPGEYLIVARRTGKKWFVAGNTNEQPRTIQIPLEFLGEGRYHITTFNDSANSDYIKNKESYKISTFSGVRKTIIKAQMAPGGGFCMILSNYQAHK